MWPFTPLTTYIANSVPYIKAFDLNKLQEYITHLFNGARTLIKLQVDGTGDQATSVGAGDIQASGGLQVGKLVAGNGPGATTAIPAGYLGIGNTLHGWAVVSSAGTFVRGKNVKAVTRVAKGQYRVTFFNALTDNNAMLPLWCSLQSGRRCDYAFTQQTGTDVKVELFWVDNTNAAEDADFSCGLFGE